MKESSKPTVAIVASHPIQHFCPLYKELAKSNEFRLKVLFGSTAGVQPYFDLAFEQVICWQEDLLDGFDYEFLPGAERCQHEAGPVANRELGSVLDRIQPDVVQIYGFYHGISRRALYWSLRRGRKLMLVSDSELRWPRSRAAKLRKAVTVPLMLRTVDAFLTIGDCNEAYYRCYGADPRKCFRSPYPIDEARLTAARSDRATRRRLIREKLNLKLDAVVALYVGKMTDLKCPEHAIKAIAAASQRGLADRLSLVLAGDGPKRVECEDLASQLAPHACRFAGFVPVTELPNYYVAADLLVHPSSADPHPLATSEAVFCGLPVVASDRVGSIGPTDDVRLGRNGWEYPFGNIEKLSHILEFLVTDADALRRAQKESIDIASERTLAKSVHGFTNAVAAVCDNGTS
jgi:glycosyltransferase involved in cell wall biosynthesis